MDIMLLRLMRNRDNFKAISPILRKETVDARTWFLLSEYYAFFKQFKDVYDIDAESWSTWFEQFRHKELSKEEKATYRAVMGQAFEDVPDAIAQGILKRVHEMNLATRLANLADAYDRGEEIELYEAVQSEFDKFKLDIKVADETGNWIQEPIEDLLIEEERDDGIHFRLGCLNHSMRPLRAGDFGIFAGRPDRGKTTFLTSECTYWASQCPDNRPVLWLNNEGPGRRIIPRLYQAALNLTMPELIEESNKGTLVSRYADAIGGSIDRIRVVDVHGHTFSQIQTIVEAHNPYIIIVDMIDHVKAPTGEARTDRILEELYKSFRELAVTHDCAIVATSQISADGDGLLFPQQHMLKDSKTGKQGACDFIVMMGASNDPMLQSIRGIGCEKNKLARAGRPANPRAEVHFDPQRARLIDDDLPEG